MLFLIILPALVLLGIIACFAFSKKSVRAVRIAAYAALALIFGSVGVSLAVIFGLFSTTDRAGEVIAEFPVKKAAEQSGELWTFAAFAVFFLALLGVVIAAFIREQRKTKEERNGSAYRKPA
jgi:MFS-type transporter involved in bile tolerance (Atg22 family)